jgi:hypothetical protein
VAKKRKTLNQKVASLSALGVGAVVAGAGTAEASVVYYPNVNAEVGFGINGAAFYQSPGLGSNSASFAFVRQAVDFGTGGSSIHGRFVGAYGCGCVWFATTGNSFLKLVKAGVNWTSAMASYTSARIGGRIWGALGTVSSPPSPFATSAGPISSFSDMYALFNFDSGPNTLYGWIHLSFSVSPQFGDDPSFGPSLTILDFAYDDTGAQLAAGVTSTPEPSTAVSTGLAALALGAAGLRPWRKLRPAA